MATSAAGWFFENKEKNSVCQLQDLAMDVSGRCIPGILNGLQVNGSSQVIFAEWYFN